MVVVQWLWYFAGVCWLGSTTPLDENENENRLEAIKDTSLPIGRGGSSDDDVMMSWVLWYWVWWEQPVWSNQYDWFLGGVTLIIWGGMLSALIELLCRKCCFVLRWCCLKAANNDSFGHLALFVSRCVIRDVANCKQLCMGVVVGVGVSRYGSLENYSWSY